MMFTYICVCYELLCLLMSQSSFHCSFILREFPLHSFRLGQPAADSLLSFTWDHLCILTVYVEVWVDGSFISEPEIFCHFLLASFF
jgi:hypothetical protein